jgi:hypothetical protein
MPPTQVGGNAEPDSTRPPSNAPGPFHVLARTLLHVASFVSALVAVWLVAVIALVLPARDPAHIPMWICVAVGFLGLAVLSRACVTKGAGHRELRVSLLLASIAAIGFGFRAIGEMVEREEAGLDSEGSIVLMGLILVGHGVVALAYLLSGRDARRPAPR